MALLTLAALVGNLVLIVAVFFNRRQRISSNTLIVSLAIADLMVAILVMPFSLYSVVNEHRNWGKSFCTAWIALDMMFCTASILNIFFISLNRYFQIVHCLWYMTWMTPTKMLKIILLIWVLSSAISVLPVVLGIHGPLKEDSGEYSEQCLPGLHPDPIFAMLTFVFIFLIPCCGMIYFYVCIYFQTHGQERSSYISHASGLVGRQRHGLMLKLTASRKKAAVSLGILIGCFLLSWTPFFILVFLSVVYQPFVSKMSYSITTWLGYASSAFNPFIYSELVTGNFRVVIMRIFNIVQSKRTSTLTPKKQISWITHHKSINEVTVHSEI